MVPVADELQVATFLFMSLIVLPVLVGAVLALVIFVDESRWETPIVRRHPDRSSEEGRPAERQLRKAS